MSRGNLEDLLKKIEETIDEAYKHCEKDSDLEDLLSTASGDIYYARQLLDKAIDYLR